MFERRAGPSSAPAVLLLVLGLGTWVLGLGFAHRKIMLKCLVFRHFLEGGEFFLPVKHAVFEVFLRFDQCEMPFSPTIAGFFGPNCCRHLPPLPAIRGENFLGVVFAKFHNFFRRCSSSPFLGPLQIPLASQENCKVVRSPAFRRKFHRGNRLKPELRTTLQFPLAGGTCGQFPRESA
jgi:hypothetical protein